MSPYPRHPTADGWTNRCRLSLDAGGVEHLQPLYRKSRCSKAAVSKQDGMEPRRR